MTFQSSATIPRLYRMKFHRDIFKDLSKLEKSYKDRDDGSKEMEIEDLEIFENVAYIMAFHADPTIPPTIEEWLDQFDMFSIYEVLPEILEEGLAKFGGKKPNKAAIKLPLRDGDTERDDPAYANSYFLNANSQTAPQIVDQDVVPIFDHNEVYSGVYARVSLTFYAFNSNGNKGVACGLGNIQKVRDGEPLGGRTSAADDFATLDDDDFLA